MNRAFLILFACAFPAFAADPSAVRPFGDGEYIGMEPMPGFHDPVNKFKDQWFHQNTLVIEGGTVTLDKIPVFFYKGRKGYSSSDGGFFTFRGAVSFMDGHWRMELLLTESDYVAVPIDTDGKPIAPKPLQFTITPAKDGSLRIGKVTYRRSKSE